MQKLILFISMLVTTGLAAQRVDMERMNRNIEASENILSTLFESASQASYDEDDDDDDGNFFVFKNRNKNSVEGTYIQGFGALFTVSPSFVLNSDGRFIVRNVDGLDRIVIDNQAVYKIERKKSKNRWREDSEDYVAYRDSTYTRNLFQKAVKEFVKDYAYLLRQIPANEKIMIRLGGKPTRHVVSGIAIYPSAKRSGKTYYSASILKSDIDDFHSSKGLTEESLYRKIDFSFPEEIEESGEDRNYSMVSNIFTDLYRNNDDNILNLNARVSHEKINGLGAIYYIDMNRYFGVTAPVITLRGKVDNVFEMSERDELPERPEEGEREYPRDDSDERKRELQEAYDSFLEDLKFNIIEYGSIVRELKTDEALIFKVRFDQRRKVLPQEVEITAAEEILKDFRSSKVSLEQAAERLKVQETY